MITEATQHIFQLNEIRTHGIAEIDSNGCFISANNTYLRLHGISCHTHSIIGNHINCIVPEAFTAIDFNDMISNPAITEHTALYYTSRCSNYRLSMDITLHVNDGHTSKAVIVVSDIADIASTIETERMLRDMYRSICEDQSEIIIRILATGHIIFTNDAACRFFGTTKSEMYGTPISQRYFARLQQLLQSKAGYPQKSMIYYKKYSRYIDYTARLTCDEKGEPFIFTFVGRDVTEQIDTTVNLARLFYNMVTSKEREILDCLIKNMKRKEIAHVLDITTNSYDTLIARIKKRWGTTDISGIITIISRYYKNDITTDLW